MGDERGGGGGGGGGKVGKGGEHVILYNNTILYADWTLSRINSLTHSHLVVLILFYRRRFSQAWI